MIANSIVSACLEPSGDLYHYPESRLDILRYLLCDDDHTTVVRLLQESQTSSKRAGNLINIISGFGTMPGISRPQSCGPETFNIIAALVKFYNDGIGYLDQIQNHRCLNFGIISSDTDQSDVSHVWPTSGLFTIVRIAETNTRLVRYREKYEDRGDYVMSGLSMDDSRRISFERRIRDSLIRLCSSILNAENDKLQDPKNPFRKFYRIGCEWCTNCCIAETTAEAIGSHSRAGVESRVREWRIANPII